MIKMMDTIYEMIGWVKYLGTLGDTFERYNTNNLGKKILLFPISRWEKQRLWGLNY